MNQIHEGSVILIDAGQAFVVLKRNKEFTIAEATEEGIEMKDVSFATLSEMEAWFNEGESKISKVIPYQDYLIRLHRLAEKEVGLIEDEKELVADRTIESLGLSVRTYNALKRAGINSESQIRNKTYDEITKIRNFARKSLIEVEQTLNMKFE